MITVIDNKRKKSYVCSKKFAGELIGVCTKTIIEWSKSKETEVYNNFLLVFDCVIVKQKKGSCKNLNKKVTF